MAWSSADLSENDPDAYLGLPVDRARRRATEQGWKYIREFDRKTGVTGELVDVRINLVVEHDRVTHCWFG